MILNFREWKTFSTLEALTYIRITLAFGPMVPQVLGVTTGSRCAHGVAGIIHGKVRNTHPFKGEFHRLRSFAFNTYGACGIWYSPFCRCEGCNHISPRLSISSASILLPALSVMPIRVFNMFFTQILLAVHNVQDVSFEQMPHIRSEKKTHTHTHFHSECILWVLLFCQPHLLLPVQPHHS